MLRITSNNISYYDGDLTWYISLVDNTWFMRRGHDEGQEGLFLHSDSCLYPLIHNIPTEIRDVLEKIRFKVYFLEHLVIAQLPIGMVVVLSNGMYAKTIYSVFCKKIIESGRLVLVWETLYKKYKVIGLSGAFVISSDVGNALRHSKQFILSPDAKFVQQY